MTFLYHTISNMPSNHQIEIEKTDMVDNLHFHPISPEYRSVQLAYATVAYILLASVALLLLLVDNTWWCIAAEVAIAFSFIINLVILREAYRFKGYALREHDITYRSGVIFPKTTTIPFNRVQQVSISQNPVTKFFELYAIDVVNGAQGFSSLVIHGLPTAEADAIKSIITQKINNDND